jgi:Cu2+-containing amine oxidase
MDLLRSSYVDRSWTRGAEGDWRPATRSSGCRPAILGLVAALLVAATVSPAVLAQDQPAAAPTEEAGDDESSAFRAVIDQEDEQAEPVDAQAMQETQAERERQRFQPLTEDEAQQAVAAVRSDARVGPQVQRADQRVQVVNVELHEEDKRAPRPRRRADVVLYDYDADETTAAVVTLGNNPRVESVVVRKGVQPQLSGDEAEQAKQLALADSAVRGRLRQAGMAGREGELIVTHIQVKAIDPRDPCATHRCVLLSFHTRRTNLYIDTVVDLTDRRVELQ